MTSLSNRVKSLDMLRGVTIVLMILGSYHGNVLQSYSPLIQTFGCGWALADLVVPTFLWTIGLSLNLSISARRARGFSERQLFVHVVHRSVALLAIGFALDALPCIDAIEFIECLSEPRLFGIFQRIAISYLCAAPIVLLLGWRGQLVVLVLIVLGYQFLYLDTLHTPVCDPTYRRNFATTLPSICYILAGSVTKASMGNRDGNFDHRGLGMLSAILIFGALLLEPYLPFFVQQLNFSFFLLSTGAATLAFTLFNIVTTKRLEATWAAPLVALGMNPLMLYLLSASIYQAGHNFGVHSPTGDWIPIWQFGWMVCASATGFPKLSSLLMSLALLAISTGIAWIMARKGIVIRI